MSRRHVWALIGVLCALALALSAALAEENVISLPEDVSSVDMQAGGLSIEDPALIDGLVDADALSMPAELDLGELRLDDGLKAAAQENVAANDGEVYWDQGQFEAWYEGQKKSAQSADHILGPEDGDMHRNRITAIFPGETVAVVPTDAGISDSGMEKYGLLTFGFTIYQLDDPVVETTYYGDAVDLLPRTGVPAKTALTVVQTAEMHIPYRAREGFTNIDGDSISKVTYVSLYRNDTGHPILYYRDSFNKSESVGKMLGYGGNNSSNPSFQGSGMICSQPELYFTENYYEVKYDYGDAAKGELSYPDTAPAAYADRIYIDREDHTYQMPRPVRKGYLFDGWNNWDDWRWGWLASHGTSTQEDERQQSVSCMTDDAYTYKMNFATVLEKIEESTFFALKDVTLSARFITAGVGGCPSCLTVGFDPRGGTINGKEHLICETCLAGSYEFALDVGKYVPVREDYVFEGWCTNPKDEAGTLIKDTKPGSASAWAQDAHTELYAVWKSSTPATISIAEAKVAAIKAQTYTGKAIKPAVTVTLSGKALKKGADYTVAYRNNTKVGTATVTITGKGDYSGTVSASFRIKPASLAKAKVTDIGARTYTGKAIKPAVKVTLSGRTLKKGTDYTVTYKNNKAIGKAKLTVKGKGNYTGSVSKTFAINPKAVSLASLTAGKGKLTVKWKKGTGGAGYQLQYSLKNTFASSKKVTITKTATVSRVLKNLKSGKTYYVRIRSYKLVDGKAYISAWSKVLSRKVN